MTPALLAIALLSLCCARPTDSRTPSSIMQPLISHPQPAVAETIPTGVASTDGRLVFVSSAGGARGRGGPAGIDALDAATGTTAWSTTDASIPILALPDALLAIRGADPIDGAWTGPGALVAIDLAAPHAARSGPPFELSLLRHRLLDVRIEGDAVVTGWYARGEPGGITAAPTPRAGGLRIDLATGAATVLERDVVPDEVRPTIAGQSLWSPAGRGMTVWHAAGGWSAVILVPAEAGRAPTLHHWSPGGPPVTARLVEAADIDRASLEHVDAHRLYLRVCDRASPARCELRVLDAATAAPIAALADPAPPAARLEPPYGLVGRTLFATQSASPGERALVAFDLDGGHERWRRPIAARAPVRRP